MLKILKLILSFILFFSYLSVFSYDSGFRLDSVKGGDVKLIWSKNKEVPYKQIFYGEKSSNIGSYSNETNLFEEDSYTIKGLSLDKTYYFSLVGMDSNGEKIFTSDEIKVNIGDFGVKDSADAGSLFKLKEVTHFNLNKIKLTFSNLLAEKQNMEDFKFEVKSVSDNSKMLNVSKTEIDEEDSHNLILTLDEEPQIDIEYKVVALSVFDKDGNTIKYGVDSEFVFKGIDFSKITNDNDFNNLDNNIDLNSAGLSKDKHDKKENSDKKTQVVIGGKDLKESEVKKDIKGTSDKKEKLPKAGPEMIILFLVAIVLSSIIFLPKLIRKS